MRRVAVTLLVSCVVVGATEIPAAAWESWKPRMGAATRFADRRHGSVSVAFVGEKGKLRAHRGRRTRPSASVIKVMFMVAYLRRASVRDRPLRERDRDLLGPMIRWSDNGAATRVADLLGARRVRRLARDAGMRRFGYTRPWGLSEITAGDQARFFWRLEDYVPRRHEDYTRRLLSGIVASQRWGIPRIRRHRWKIYFKGGWGSGTGRVCHQVAFLEKRGHRIAVAILTERSPSHRYAVRTIRGVAQRLLRDLP